MNAFFSSTALSSINYNNLPAHALAERYALPNPHEMAAMEASIRQSGLLQPIVIWFYAGVWWILDGRTRHAICISIGYEFKPNDFKVFHGTLEEAARFVDSANSARRHLSLAQKTDRARQLITEHPGKSSREIALICGLSHTTVGGLRRPPPQNPQLTKLLQAWDQADYDAQVEFCLLRASDIEDRFKDLPKELPALRQGG
jgi:ParB-like chromosome segregation protein Spo0J